MDPHIQCEHNTLYQHKTKHAEENCLQVAGNQRYAGYQDTSEQRENDDSSRLPRDIAVRVGQQLNERRPHPKKSKHAQRQPMPRQNIEAIW